MRSTPVVVARRGTGRGTGRGTVGLVAAGWLAAGSLAGALAVGSLSACLPPVREPGPLRDLVVSLRLLPLADEELRAIGSFDLEVLRDGELVASAGLSFDADAQSLTNVDAAPEIAAGGVIEVILTARAFDGGALGVGGRAPALNLDALPADAPARVPILVGRQGAFSALARPLDEPRFLHTATPLAGGVLVVGGATSGSASEPGALATLVEWLEPVADDSCTSADTSACPLRDPPPPRVGHVAVDLDAAFASDCPVRGALVALGSDADGQPLRDAYLLESDPPPSGGGGAFVRLPDLPRARSGAVAVALRSCRVLIVGGHGDDGLPLAAIDVLDLSDGIDGASSAPGGQLPLAVVEPTAIATRNALDEVIVVGGRDAGGQAVRGGAVVAETLAGALTVCALADAGCNGAVAALLCARAGAVAAPLADGTDTAPALLIGGDGARACTDTPAEVFRAGLEPPFAAFVSTGAPAQTRVVGASASPIQGGRAVVVGGVGGLGGNEVLASAEVFALDAALGQASAGAFTATGALTSARAFHSATPIAGAVVIVGGGGLAGPLGLVEVFVPELLPEPLP